MRHMILYIGWIRKIGTKLSRFPLNNTCVIDFVSSRDFEDHLIIIPQ